jgi:hypothetical protein
LCCRSLFAVASRGLGRSTERLQGWPKRTPCGHPKAGTSGHVESVTCECGRRGIFGQSVRERLPFACATFQNRRFAASLSLLIRAFNDPYFNLEGRRLEGLSRLFAQTVRMYTYPMTGWGFSGSNQRFFRPLVWRTTGPGRGRAEGYEHQEEPIHYQRSGGRQELREEEPLRE